MPDASDHSNFIGLTAEIVSAYVSNNTVASNDIPALINQVHSALLKVSIGETPASSEPLRPAVPVKRSINPDFLVCLEHVDATRQATAQDVRDLYSKGLE